MRQLNFLYLLGPLSLSRWQNNEIRYSLRSLEDFNPDWVGVAGPEIPSFLSGIEHIKVDIKADISRYKNMQNQLIAACSLESTPEELILMNDDFILRPSPPWDWTPTYTGDIEAELKKPNGWRRTVVATGHWCRARGIENPLCYEGHTPMPFLKSKALPILRELVAAPDALQFRSAYGNVVGIGGKLFGNAKRGNLENWPADSPFVSLKSSVTDKAKSFLENWLTKPSRWEASNEVAT